MSQPAAGQNPYTRWVAEFVSQLRYEQIPETVRERLRAERKGSIREVEVASVDLRMFDELCGSGEVLQ